MPQSPRTERILTLYLPSRLPEAKSAAGESALTSGSPFRAERYPITYSYVINLGIGFRTEMDIPSGLRYEGVKLIASMQGQRQSLVLQRYAVGLVTLPLDLKIL